jgi:radical SAM-linked protein
MVKIRSKFYKKEEMVFISHLDLIRVFERAIRRADIPVAYTQGFNPHPIMAFATALGIGVSSDAEYMDMELEKEVEMEQYRNSLNEVLPSGLGIIQCIPVPKSEKSLMSIIKRSVYLVKIPLQEMLSINIMNEELKKFLENEMIIEVKEAKKKKFGKREKGNTTEKNIRNSIIMLEIHDYSEKEVVLQMILTAGSTDNLKPETVVNKLKELTLLPIEKDGVRIHRVELLMEKEGEYITPI